MLILGIAIKIMKLTLRNSSGAQFTIFCSVHLMSNHLSDYGASTGLAGVGAREGLSFEWREKSYEPGMKACSLSVNLPQGPHFF